MRFATRTFLASFVPHGLLLMVSFCVIRSAVLATVRDGLETAARDNQLALAREQSREEVRYRRTFQSIAANPTLKAGLQLLTGERSAREEAFNTVRDQLSEIGDSSNFDFMMVSSEQRVPLAAVIREAHGFRALGVLPIQAAGQDFLSIEDLIYEVRSVPIDEGGEQVAVLTVGHLFDISRFGIPAVLLHGGKVIAGGTRGVVREQTEAPLRQCAPGFACDVRIEGKTYLSLPLGAGAGSSPNGFILRSLQSVDAASARVQAVLRRLFLLAGIAALAAAIGITALSSHSIARPLAGMVARLRHCTATGDLPEFPETAAGPQEIRNLSESFNQAAKAVRESRERLTRAYVEFTGSLAQALDARDPSTAGHSRRVSDYSRAIAKALELPPESIETVRVGALLHDLGKIGISDLVLQKPGRLTPEEERLIRQHPEIGRRILEKVQGFEPYLPIIELHHENWDGTGYPHGLKADQTPLHARIVKIADSYDAMTSDRPYRRGMAHADAISILKKASGTEMDRGLAEVFAGLFRPEEGPETARSVIALAHAVSYGTETPVAQLEHKEAS